jgi:GNAT superfamily N-acetyltransferase
MVPAERPALADPAITVSESVDEAVRARLLAGLDAALPAEVAPFRPRPLAVLLHNATGRLVGGLNGRSFCGWLVIELLWVDEALRRAGHGRRLLARAEAEARRRGCHHARVDTYSFQAPGFYEKCGYGRFATMDDCPIGHQRSFYARALL